MKSWTRLALGGLLLGVATATVVPLASRGIRSVRPSDAAARTLSTHFDRRQSAALFIGVRQFASDSIEDVPFAVDDAVDLAYVFALEPRVRLVPPRRIVLALSGRPVKPQSRERLRALRDAGAEVRSAGVAEIVDLLRRQTALAGRDGLLVVSMATHGFVRAGSSYILGASSHLRNPATMLAMDAIFDAIASSNAQRSLVFVDACRDRVETGTRSVLADAMSAAPVAHRLNRTRGQVVFYAAAPGEWAYDDPDARNGVFTKAVIAGINCGAAKVRGVVTAESLAGYVERTVRTWIRDKKDENVGSATQVTMDGEARNMPLAQCTPIAPALGPSRAVASGTSVRALTADNEPLWSHEASSAVTSAEAIDLDGDGAREVVAATRNAIEVLDANGTLLWTAREPMDLGAVTTGDLLRQGTNEVVALWTEARTSRILVYAPDGARLAELRVPRRIDRIAIGRPNKRYLPRIVATAGDVVAVFDLKKLTTGKPLWAGRVSGSIAALEFLDYNGDGDSEIGLTMSDGGRVFVDFAGHAVDGRSDDDFERVAPRLALTGR